MIWIPGRLVKLVKWKEASRIGQGQCGAVHAMGKVVAASEPHGASRSLTELQGASGSLREVHEPSRAANA